MIGAIFYSGKYGSTALYAKWIGDATGLPLFDVNQDNTDPSKYDFVVLGSSVIISKLTIRKWLKRNLDNINNKPLVLFSVSGEPPGPKLDSWIANSLPISLKPHCKQIALRGRLDLNNVRWWIRLLLKVGGWLSNDPETKENLLNGFDLVDKSTIDPIVALVKKLQSDQVPV